MKKTKIFAIYTLLTISIGWSSCDVGPTDALMEIISEDLGFIPVISSFTLASPTASENTPTPGTNCVFDLRFWSEGELESIEFWQRIDSGDLELIATREYTPAFSNISKTDSLLFNYTIPSNVPAGTVIGMEARVFNRDLPDFPVSRVVNVTVR